MPVCVACVTCFSGVVAVADAVTKMMTPSIFFAMKTAAKDGIAVMMMTETTMIANAESVAAGAATDMISKRQPKDWRSSSYMRSASQCILKRHR